MGRLPEVRSSRPAWPTWRNPISTKNRKISWALWHNPVIPATQEAETGESLEPRMQREVAVSWDRATALQPGQQTKILSQKQTKKPEIYAFIWNLTILYVGKQFILKNIINCWPTKHTFRHNSTCSLPVSSFFTICNQSNSFPWLCAYAVIWQRLWVSPGQSLTLNTQAVSSTQPPFPIKTKWCKRKWKARDRLEIKRRRYLS